MHLKNWYRKILELPKCRIKNDINKRQLVTIPRLMHNKCRLNNMISLKSPHSFYCTLQNSLQTNVHLIPLMNSEVYTLCSSIVKTYQPNKIQSVRIPKRTHSKYWHQSVLPISSTLNLRAWHTYIHYRNYLLSAWFVKKLRTKYN